MDYKIIIIIIIAILVGGYLGEKLFLNKKKKK